LALAYEKQQGKHLNNPRISNPNKWSSGYLYPSQGKLAVRILARAVRPPLNSQFEKLTVGLPGAVRPLPWGG
jgi:hypothetical protein